MDGWNTEGTDCLWNAEDTDSRPGGKRGFTQILFDTYISRWSCLARFLCAFLGFFSSKIEEEVNEGNNFMERGGHGFPPRRETRILTDFIRYLHITLILPAAIVVYSFWVFRFEIQGELNERDIYGTQRAQTISWNAEDTESRPGGKHRGHGFFSIHYINFPEQDAPVTFQTVRRLSNKNNFFNDFLWLSKNNLILASMHLSNCCG